MKDGIARVVKSKPKRGPTNGDRIRGVPGETLRDEGLTYIGRGCLVFDAIEGYGGRISAVGIKDTDPHGREVALADVRLDALRDEVARAEAVALERARAKKRHEKRPPFPEVELSAAVEAPRNVWSVLDFSKAVYGDPPPPVELGERVTFGRGVLEFGVAPRAIDAISRTVFTVREVRKLRPAIDSHAVRRLHGSTVAVYLHVIGSEIVHKVAPETIPVATLVPTRVRSTGIVNHRRGKIVNGFTVYSPDGDRVGEFTTCKAVDYCKEQGWEMDRRGVAPRVGEVKNRANTPYRG